MVIIVIFNAIIIVKLEIIHFIKIIIYNSEARLIFVIIKVVKAFSSL